MIIKKVITNLSAIIMDSRQYRYLILVKPLPIRITCNISYLQKPISIVICNWISHNTSQDLYSEPGAYETKLLKVKGCSLGD